VFRGMGRRVASAALAASLAATAALAVGGEPAAANAYPQKLVVSADPVDFTPNILDGHVTSITTAGNRVIVGGTFTQVKAAGNPTVLSRRYLFAFDRTTGMIDTGFVPVLDGAVEALEVAADGTSVYVAGAFATVNGVSNFGITKLDAATGARVTAFAASTAGKVRDIALSGDTLYLGGDIWSINGVPRSRMGAVDAITGAVDPTFTVGTTAPRVSVDWVAEIDVSPDGSQLVVMGNFMEVDGVERKQIALIDLNGPQATLADWSTQQFGAACGGSFWTYMRDVEYSVDGEFFAIVTTGGPFTGTLCDTASRWESSARGSNLVETWADWSGGDTLTAVAISDVAVYIGGHQRWMNNHLGKDTAAVGAVSREGIAALDIVNGVPLSWNPGKDRGVAVWDLHLSDLGLYVGSDTDFTAGEYHAKLAQFPLAGGTPVPVTAPATLPTTVYTGGSGTTLDQRSFDGGGFGAPSAVPGNPIDWTGVGGAFYEADSIYYLGGFGLIARTFDGVSFGPAVAQPSWPDWSSLTSAAWDDGKLYYTQSGSSQLRYRYFSLESGIVGSQTFTVTAGGVDWTAVVAMDFVGGDLYYARSDGNLWAVEMGGGVPVGGTERLVSGPGTGDGLSWAVPALFFLSTDAAPTVTMTTPVDGAVVSGAAVTVGASAADDDAVAQVEFFAGAVSLGVDTNGADGWSVAWDTTAAADGAVTLIATATDTIGQAASDTVGVTVDNLGPAVAVTSPADGATVAGVVEVTADASDAVGVAQVEFFAGAVSLGVDTNGADGWSASWDSATSPDGPVTLTATATDTFGRTADGAVSVTVDNSGGGVVLMVVGNPASLSTGDAAVRDRLQSLGYTVTFGDDDAVSPADAAGTSFVVLSSTINSNVVGAAFREVAQPVWVAKPWSLDDMGMTGPTGNVDYGTVSSATVTITDSSHPLAAGRSGTVAVTTSSRAMSFGVPSGGGSVVATAAGEPVTFVYPAGATLADGAAAAGCRLTSSIFQGAPTLFTADGWALFDAAARYAGANCQTPPPPVTGDHVILVTVDGLRPDAVTSQGPGVLPNLYRFIDGGATTANARTVFESTQTLPNHLSIVTGVPVAGPSGHNVTFNEDDGLTVHDAAGRYVPSMFDVAHDAGLSTALFAGKPKFDFVDRSWNDVNGAPDVTGADDGPDKIDHYERGDGTTITASFLARMATSPYNLSMVHYAGPDAAGHDFGWTSPEYLASVQAVDGYIGDILDAVEADPDLSGNTVVVLVADHGGAGTSHQDETAADNYTIPFYAWGADVPPGASLYTMNPGVRLDPGTGRPDYDADPQPIRNGDAANLLLQLLGLGAVPGSVINAAQDLAVTGEPGSDAPPTVTLTAPSDGAAVAGAVVVVADAGDDFAVTQVEFFAGGMSLGVDTEAGDGWSVTWDTTSSPDGAIALAATATDTSGQTGTDSISVTVANTSAGVVLMVVSDATNPASQDVVVRDQLLGAGYTVDVVDDASASAADAVGASFVLVASSVNANAVGTDFRDVPVPVWVAKPFLFDDMGMTGTSNNTDYGTTKASTITIVDPAHPLAAGLSGDVTVTSGNRSISFGIPGADADVVATVAGAPAIFAYQAGAQLVDGTSAAGCRLHFPIFQTAVLVYTTDAWNLFDGAAAYAANGCG
jgi:hypothetical protein